MNNSSTCVLSLFECDLEQGLILKEKLHKNFVGYIINGYHKEIDKICELVIQCQSSLLLENFTKKINDKDTANNNELNQGFIIHQWSLEKLKEVLSTPESLLVCIVDIENNKLAGYLLFASLKYLYEDISSQLGELILDGKVITEQQWKQYVSTIGVHYIKQIGVDKDYHRQGIGTHLIILSQKQSSQGLCALVLLSPYYNSASANCLEKNQFQPIGIWKKNTPEESVPFKAKLFIWPFTKSII
ncbi:unnamed protein product [Adineta steineri]|uniref:N-acetyltransferase domain-containing protein n=4 Tax=Adineta steineri TaxID=433720 RepID=A0A815LLT1_9BILA|nr:unnamed protein product [Adineta steineri]